MGICGASRHGLPRDVVGMRLSSLTLRLRAKIARGPRNYKSTCSGPNLIRTGVRLGLEAAAETLELRERLGVELVAQIPARAVDVLGLDELRQEPTRRELAHLHPGRLAHRFVRRDDRDLLAHAELRGE